MFAKYYEDYGLAKPPLLRDSAALKAANPTAQVAKHSLVQRICSNAIELAIHQHVKHLSNTNLLPPITITGWKFTHLAGDCEPDASRPAQ